jgi:hypothetical protein
VPMHTTTRIIRSALLCALAASAAPLVTAQDIFKCIDGGGTTYQSTPCASGQGETRMATGAVQPRAEVQVAALSPPAMREPSRIAGPWRRTTLTLGMSDDEVLNLPGWGRPTRITRAKMSRVWHEEWTYGSSAAGGRRLHFANARLVDIIDKPPLDQVAQLTVQ